MQFSFSTRRVKIVAQSGVPKESDEFVFVDNTGGDFEISDSPGEPVYVDPEDSVPGFGFRPQKVTEDG